MSDIRKKNLELIRKQIPELYKKIVKINNQIVEVVPAKSGTPTAKYSINEETFLLHSKFNPQQEADSIIENSNLKADHIFLFGLGQRGIQPHFTVVAEPSYLNYEHLMGVEEAYKGFIVTESGVAQQIFKDYTKQIFTATLNKPLSIVISDAVGGIGLSPA